MNKYRMKLIDTCNSKEFFYNVTAINETEAINKMYKSFPGGVVYSEIEKIGEIHNDLG